jgi:hypothetical protein
VLCLRMDDDRLVDKMILSLDAAMLPTAMPRRDLVS